MHYDDNKEITLTTEFPWSEVDEKVFGVVEKSPDWVESTLECQRRIWQWVYQGSCEDLDGFMCRSIVVCWVFVPVLRSYTMTEIAGRFGKKKQSLGRWVVDFKKEFPDVTAHLQHIRNE